MGAEISAGLDVSRDGSFIAAGLYNETVQFRRFVKAKPVEYAPEYIPQPDMPPILPLTIALIAPAIMPALYLPKRGR